MGSHGSGMEPRPFPAGGPGDMSPMSRHLRTVGSDAPSPLAVRATGSPLAHLCLVDRIVGMPIVSSLASLSRLPKQRPR